MKSRIYVLGIVGFLCITYSITLLPPMLVAAWYQDGELDDFFITFILLVSIGYLLWAPFRNKLGELRRSDGFLIVAIFWMLLSLISALPFMTGWHLDFVDSLFEATSGFTTTGATVVTNLKDLPPSILYYRQQLQFFGGMGLIVLAIAVLPMLGVGGTQLYRAETPGPMKDEKMEPRIAQTVRGLSLIYFGLTVFCALGYWLAGMQPLDALEHSFSTVSTGGFSTHDESLGYFHNQMINYIAVLFMLLGAINFGIHFIAMSNRKLSAYLVDTEVRTFLLTTGMFVFFYTVYLYFSREYSSLFQSLNYSLFEVTSVITSTGYGITDFSTWPLFLPVLLIFISFVGGCGGSTAGGIKVIRIMTLFKEAANQLFLLVHPKSCRPVKIGARVLNYKTAQAIWGFFAVYISSFVLLTILMVMAGLDEVTAFSAVAACINNLGPGLGGVSATFASVSDNAKLIAVAAMLLGRLEIFTLLVIVTPEFWRR